MERITYIFSWMKNSIIFILLSDLILHYLINAYLMKYLHLLMSQNRNVKNISNLISMNSCVVNYITSIHNLVRRIQKSNSILMNLNTIMEITTIFASKLQKRYILMNKQKLKKVHNKFC